MTALIRELYSVGFVIVATVIGDGKEAKGWRVDLFKSSKTNPDASVESVSLDVALVKAKRML